MLRRVLPILLALMTMTVVMIVVLSVRPEVRAELGRLRKEGPIEIEPPTT